MTEKKVIIYSDGGSDPNPGIGGWAAILRYGDNEKVLTGNHPQATNNRMELQAAISALAALKRSSVIEFHIDSQYVRKGITEWIEGWAAKGWKQSNGKPVLNVDLWKLLWEQSKRHEIDWQWVKGHSGNEYNERVDMLARKARLEITPTVTVDESAPKLYVRSSCKGNPGPGGWGVILEHDGQTTQLSGWEPQTTNNRMELMAIIEGLSLIPLDMQIQLFTSSDYAFQGSTKWIHGWRKRNWKKKGDQPVANSDLWKKIDDLITTRKIHFINAKGQTHVGMDEAGQLAVNAAGDAAEA